MTQLTGNINRRGFIKLAGAAGLTPALPMMMPASMGATASTGVKSSQMLWASLAGKARNASHLASKVGISAESAVGICAKLNSPHVLAARSASNLRRVARPAQTVTKTPSTAKSVGEAAHEIDLEERITEDQLKIDAKDEIEIDEDLVLATPDPEMVVSDEEYHEKPQPH